MYKLRELHSQKGLLFGYTTVNLQLSSSFQSLHKSLSRKGTKLHCDNNFYNVCKTRLLHGRSVILGCFFSSGEYLYIDD